MHDHGERIVSLAREILRGDNLPELPETSARRVSVKILCLSTFLAALCGAGADHVLAESYRPLNCYEKTEVDALVFYTARQKNLTEDEVRRAVLQKFKLSNFDAMTEHDFHAVRSYLQGQAD